MSRKKIKIVFIIGVISAVTAFGVVFWPSNNSIGMDDFTFNTLTYDKENFIILTPRFTEAAYSDHGFYWYYDGRCGEECLTVPVQHGELQRWGAFNLRSIAAFAALGWPMMDDITAHKKILQNPNYLLQYDTIILLHNEYVTRELYQAIQNHPHVIYLNPNALYAQIKYYEGPNEIQLIQGHGYPNNSTLNGFGWQYDNSNEETDTNCYIYHWKKLPNGEQLSCMPEKIIIKQPQILMDLKIKIQTDKRTGQ